MGRGSGGLAEDFVGHLRVCRAAQGFGMEVDIIEFAVDLASLDLAERDLLLDLVENHEEMLALLGIDSVVVGHCDDCAVVLHNDGGEMERNAEFLEEGDKKVDFLDDEGEDGAGFGVGRGR